MRALASSDSRAARAMRVASIASCARRRPSTAAARSAARALGLDPDVARLDVELRQRLADAVARGRRVLERVAQRGRGVERREHLAARRFDVGFEPFDLAVRRLVGVRLRRQRRRRAVAFGVRLGRPIAARCQRQTRGFAARFQPFELGGDVRRPRLERLHLLAVERDLLLLAGDGELARVRGLARLRSPAIRLRPARCAGVRDRLPPRRRAPPRPPRARARRPGAPAPTRSSRRAGGTSARRAPSPSGAARRAAAGSAAPSPAWRFSVPRCFSTSKTMSSMRVRFCCAASSFSSAERRRALYFVTPAASSISWRRSVGRVLRIIPILPCSMIA